jgi:hypothetical protein
MISNSLFSISCAIAVFLVEAFPIFLSERLLDFATEKVFLFAVLSLSKLSS